MVLEVPEEYHDIALTLVAIISLFPAYVFWLGYRRVGTKVMLYPAIAFALYSIRTFLLVIMDHFAEIHVYMELIMLSLLALALLEKPKGEAETDNMLEETLRRKEDANAEEGDVEVGNDSREATGHSG